MEPFMSRTPLRTLNTVRMPECGRCGLKKKCKSPMMPPSGKGRRNVIIIGEAPGQDEDASGLQFVGRTGRRLQDELRKIGVDMRRDCIITNAIICRPEKNRLHNPSVVDWCRPNLTKTVLDHKPDVIITLGTVATESLIGWIWHDGDVGGISRWAGYQIPHRRLNAWICPTFHPSYVEREDNPVVDSMFARHLAAAFDLKGKPYSKPPPVPDKQISIPYNDDAVVYELRPNGCREISFDYETTTLKPDGPHAEIVSCSVCFGGERTVAYLWTKRTAQATRALLMDSSISKDGANIAFEENWTWAKLGVGVRNWRHDVNIAAHAIENGGKGRAITGVKFQAFVHLGVDDWDSHVKPFLTSRKGGGNEPNRIRRVPVRDLLIYNGLDSLYEYQLAWRQRRRLGL